MTGQHGGPLDGPTLQKSVLGRGIHRADHLGLARRFDPRAIRLEASDFAAGGLQLTSYVRPGKLFTANEALLLGTAGTLRAEKLRTILREVAGLFVQAA